MRSHASKAVQKALTFSIKSPTCYQNQNSLKTTACHLGVVTQSIADLQGLKAFKIYWVLVNLLSLVAIAALHCHYLSSLRHECRSRGTGFFGQQDSIVFFFFY